MGKTDSPHAGIELDTICLSGIPPKAEEGVLDEIRSDPDDYRIFVNSILKKMKGQDAFLSFSKQISNVNTILTMKYSSADDIARVILKDVALTSQVLKLVNSSFYRQFSQKGIATISEAMIILGTDEIRSVAASLKIFEMMQGLSNSKVLEEKTLKSLQRSIMARQISIDRKDTASDALQISAMIYDIGEYLVALFDPEKFVQVEIAFEEEDMTKQEAAKSILGLTYADLGRVVASQLNLPETIIQAIRPVNRFNVNGLSEKEQQRYVCAFIHDLCEIQMTGEDPHGETGTIADKYHGIVGIDMRKALELIQMSREKMVKHAALLKIDPGVVDEKKSTSGTKSKKALDLGLKQIRIGLDKGLSIHEIFTRMVETIHSSFYFNQVVISIRKKETNTMEPRFIMGDDRPEQVTRALIFRIEPHPDIFNNAIENQTDVIVRNIQKEAYKKQIPSWYLEKVAKPAKAQGAAIFPVFVDKKILAMIYLDWDASAPELSQKTIDYLRVFRELMIKTFTFHSNK